MSSQKFSQQPAASWWCTTATEKASAGGTPLDHRHTNLARKVRKVGWNNMASFWRGGESGCLPPLFFDLQHDAAQVHNRAADPAYAVTGRDYAQKLLSWRMRHDERVLAGMGLGPGGITTRREPRCSQGTPMA